MTMQCDRCGLDVRVLHDAAGYLVCEDCIDDVMVDSSYGSDDDCLPDSEANYHGIIE